MLVTKFFVVAVIFSLAASACGGQHLPTAPVVQSVPVPAPGVPVYRASGYVYGAEKVPIARARVSISTGAVGGVETNSSGYFELAGIPGSTATFVVVAEGYWPFRMTATVTSDGSLTFDLVPRTLAPGTYTLTIDASGDCRHRLPEGVRTRRYSAVMQDAYDPWGDYPDYVAVGLSGADFRADTKGRHNSFYGLQDSGGEVVFLLVGDRSFGGAITFAAVVEQLTPSTALVIAGEARGSSRSGFSGTLDGVLNIVSTVGSQDPDYQNPIAICRSNAHQFVLSR